VNLCEEQGPRRLEVEAGEAGIARHRPASSRFLRMVLRTLDIKKLKKMSAVGSPCLVLQLIEFGCAEFSTKNQLLESTSVATNFRCSGTPAAVRTGASCSCMHRS
jgi:hypothetical protein